MPTRLGCMYLCCHLQKARLQAPIKARGLLSRRLNQAPTSPTFTWPKGVSAKSTSETWVSLPVGGFNCVDGYWAIVNIRIYRKNLLHNSHCGEFRRKPKISMLVRLELILTLAIEASWVVDSMNLWIVLGWVVSESHFQSFSSNFLENLKNPLVVSL